MLDLFVAACEPSQVEINYAVLRAPITVVRRRVQDRRFDAQHAGALADVDVVDDLWTQFEGHSVEERHRVDSGERTPDAIAEEIDQRLQGGDFRL
jgi:hypothetical protein